MVIGKILTFSREDLTTASKDKDIDSISIVDFKLSLREIAGFNFVIFVGYELEGRNHKILKNRTGKDNIIF